MTRFESSRFISCLCVVGWLATVVACSSDDGHGPTVGAPTAPIVISEGGGTASGGSANTGGSGTAPGGSTGVAGTISATTGGSEPFGVGGSSGGSEPFGIGGSSGGSDPFGVGGSSSSFAGTLSAFSGTSSF